MDSSKSKFLYIKNYYVEAEDGGEAGGSWAQLLMHLIATLSWFSKKTKWTVNRILADMKFGSQSV